MSGLIDIRLVLTQILGFLVLVWILGRYARGPVVAQLEARRSRIAAEFEDAVRRQKEADAQKAKYEQELRGIESQARQRMLEAVAEGQRVAAEIKAQAQADAAARIARADEEIAHDQEKARELLKRQVAELSIRTAEKILRAKLDEPGQRALVERFIAEVDGHA
jgi:F-type H+-transporting ATPase subunit b